MKQILIIEDDESVRSVLKAVLEEVGYNTVVAEDGSEGIKKVCKHHPQLVITDIVMPEKDGLEIIRYLKKEHPSVRIIAITSKTWIDKYDCLRQAKLFGAHKILEKPFLMSNVLDAVKEMLALHREQCNN